MIDGEYKTSPGEKGTGIEGFPPEGKAQGIQRLPLEGKLSPKVTDEVAN